jgi:hypothetical protein
MVTLGGLPSPTLDEQLGTFMHELGHTLGLRHGGGDGIKGKPNYKSVMNYLWQMPVRSGTACGNASGILLSLYRASWGPFYSTQALPTLMEGDLDETVGIGLYGTFVVPVGPPPPDLSTPPGFVARPQLVPMYGPVNWDRKGGPTNPSAEANANHIPLCVGSGGGAMGEELEGYDDYANLVLRIPQGAAPKDARISEEELEDELTVETFEGMSAMEFDCNSNGIADQEDIDTGSSLDVDLDGIPDECTAGTVGVGDERTPSVASFTIRGNPLLGPRATEVRFDVPIRGHVEVEVFDAAGRSIALLFSGVAGPGEHRLVWAGQARNGRRVAAGVYHLRLSSEAWRTSRPLVVLP